MGFHACAWSSVVFEEEVRCEIRLSNSGIMGARFPDLRFPLRGGIGRWTGRVRIW